MKETIIQFGSGNFLRGFIGYFVHVLAEKGLYDGKIVIVQPTRGGKTDIINRQGGKYNLFLRGIENGEEKCEHIGISSVSRGVDPYRNFDDYMRLAENPDMRFIVSNTTEAGIEFDESCLFSDRPALSFPAKLTQLLHRRFALGLRGFIILPCELIDGNGAKLRDCVLKYARLWNLGEAFISWIETENKFCNTLVDRIVTGYPHGEADELNGKIGWRDELLDTAEPFHLWVIEGDFEAELPLKKAGLNVILTDDVSPYKKMKVRILNGCHTALVFPSLLCSIETVGDSLKDAQLREFLNTCLFGYILPVLGDNEVNRAFAKATVERFENPYIRHLWKSISLNSVSKFAVRVLPTVLDYAKKEGVAPTPFAFSLACLIEYYKTSSVQDDEKAVSFIKENDINSILSYENLWGTDLGFMKKLVFESTRRIHNDGIREALAWAMS